MFCFFTAKTLRHQKLDSFNFTPEILHVVFDKLCSTYSLLVCCADSLTVEDFLVEFLCHVNSDIIHDCELLINTKNVRHACLDKGIAERL